MYNCPKCNEPFEPGTKYCPNCGCNLEESFIVDPVCPICHKSYPTGSTFCTEDGSKLVSPEKLIPKCVICGTQYSADTKFCPKDGGAVIPEALRYASANHISNSTYAQKADLGKRFVASLLDGLICCGLSIPSFILYMIGMTRTSYIYYNYERDYSESIIFFMIALFLFFVPLVYSFIKDGLGNGQSWGKKIMKIKVINIANSTKCTIGKSALRNLVSSLIDCIPFVGWLIEPIMVLATEDGRRLADKAAGTMVVND